MNVRLRQTTLIAWTLLSLVGSSASEAHDLTQAEHAFTWSFEPWVVACLAASAGAYLGGLGRLWSHAGAGRGVSAWQAAAFLLGWLALAASLVSPLDTIGSDLFSVHMVQHEVMMLVAAPLMVLGRPLATWTWAFPSRTRHRLGDVTSAPAIQRPWRMLTAPLAAWTLHALALWLWHAPVLFEAALHNNGIHALQHASFLFPALLFWWALLGVPRAVTAPGATAYLFTTMIHTGALGALMTIASTPWYASYEVTAGAWGLTALEDQQIGGLIMWVPAGAVYAAVGLVLLARWIARYQPRSSIAPGTSI